MKKIVSFILLSVILVHLIGFYAYFVVRLSHIRQEMRETIALLPPEEFDVFVFKLEEYEQVRVNDHEIKINDQMYDHSKPIFKDGLVTLYAKYDEAENDLIGFLEEVVETADKDNQKVPTQVTAFFNLSFVTPGLLSLDIAQSVFQFSQKPSDKLLMPVLNIESPPPKS